MGYTISELDLVVVMELVFNEISLDEKPESSYQAISIWEKFANTCVLLKKEGFNKIRVESDFWNSLYFEYKDINTFLSQIPSRTKSSFLRSFIRRPFLADDFLSEADEKYAQNEYFWGDKKITGLAYAYLLDTICISLSTNEIWDNTDIEIIEVSNCSHSIVIVKNASKPEHTEQHRSWIEDKKPVQLIQTKISADLKEINLRDDHGKDVLLLFAKRIVISPYVTKIINSLPFNPNEKKFIRKIYPNGQIEIVLINTDQGLGIIIQTTGRNIKETEVIAYKLEKKYK